MRLGLNTKMTVAVSLLVMLLMAGLSYWIINHFDRRFKEHIAAQQYILISERAYDIDEAIQRIQQLIVTRAASITLNQVRQPQWAQHELDEAADLLTIFDHGIFLYATSGALLAEYPNLHRQGQNFAYRGYFKRTMTTGRPCISEPFFSAKANHHPIIMFTAPVFGPDHHVIAVLGGAVDLLQDNFVGHNGRLKIGKTGYAYLYNTERTIILHPDKNRILQRDEPPGVNPVFDKGILGFDGTEENVNSRGLHALTTVKHLRTTNWIMGANYPLADAYAPIREAKLRAVFAMVAGILLSTLIVWQAMKVLTAPLRLLSRHMRSISEHNVTDQEIRIDSSDEIGELATSFNLMMRTVNGKQEELRKLSRAVEQSASLVVITDRQGRIEYVNPKFCKQTGYSAEEVIGRNPRMLKSGEMSPENYQTLWREITSGNDWRCEFHNRKKNGELYWAIATISPIKNEHGETTHFICVQEDITERKEAEARLRQLSTHDMLTGLYNRTFFQEELERLARGRHFPISVIMADVDGLKGVNDLLGHEAGDRLIQAAGQVILRAVRGDDILARIGGDEFIVLLPETDRHAAQAALERIRKSEAEYNRASAELRLSISLGSATADAAEELTNALKSSDERMYQDKKARKAQERQEPQMAHHWGAGGQGAEGSFVEDKK